MDLGYGFVRGTNKISKQKVLNWLHTSKGITWKSFVWYIADYCDIEDYGDEWICVKLVSERQREFFYKKASAYNEEICLSNYEVDSQNELWKSHKKGAERNFEILRRLTQ